MCDRACSGKQSFTHKNNNYYYVNSIYVMFAKVQCYEYTEERPLPSTIISNHILQHGFSCPSCDSKQSCILQDTHDFE